MQLPTGSEPPDVRQCRDYGKAIRDRCEQKGPGKKPLNVVIVGTKGSGKSSFINSLAASLSHERWIGYSTAATYVGTRPVTSYIDQFKQCCNEEASFYEDVLLPTLTDTPGLMEVEADDPQTMKFLRLLFHGHIQKYLCTACSRTLTKSTDIQPKDLHISSYSLVSMMAASFPARTIAIKLTLVGKDSRTLFTPWTCPS